MTLTSLHIMSIPNTILLSSLYVFCNFSSKHDDVSWFTNSFFKILTTLKFVLM